MLTLVERQILYNQYRILSLLDEDGKDSYERKMKVFEYGYVSIYDDVVNVNKDEVSESDCDFVNDVLVMFSDLYYSYNELTDKSTISEILITFDGFDANNETGMYSYTLFLIKEYGRYKEFSDRSLNSHGPRIKRYQEMLNTYKEIRDRSRLKSYLNVEEILSIIKTK
ncbi:MAG: YfbU family protein [Lachnospiraceae bacterium]|jgi:uncharacterized protein YfbU (UPF0304 family)|nr:YfbU family protein [Lachnospiraceae bacterium]